MGLFRNKNSHRTCAVVDVRSSSIAAAYVVLREEEHPHIVHHARFPLDPHATEPLAEALPRTIKLVLATLIKEGGPLLVSAVGAGNVDDVFITMTAPWQTSQVTKGSLKEEKPFVLTHQMLTSPKDTVPKGSKKVSESVIATLLNGYAVRSPFGKKVQRVEWVSLTTSLDEELMARMETQVRSAFHHAKTTMNGFMPVMYSVARDLYPHLRDFLVLDVGNEATEILLVKHDLLVTVLSIPHGIGEIARAARNIGVSSASVPLAGSVSMIQTNRNTEFANSVDAAQAAWLLALKTALAEIASETPLPRTIMLLAEDSVRDFLRRLLDAPELRALWLTEQSLGILPILPAQFASYVDQDDKGADAAISILALAASKQQGGR